MKHFHHLVKYPELWGLTAAALLTRLFQLGQPNAIVFDEVYFREFASHYLDGQYFFDIHPPLVKLLFAGFGGLFGLTSEQVASGDEGTLILRLLPAIAGAFLIPLVYIIIRQLGLGRRIAVFGALLVLLDNALLVESRFVLMDSLLLLFGMGSISAYLVLRKARGVKRWVWLAVTAICLGMLVSTKWSGLAIAGLLAVTWFLESLRHKFDWRKMIGEASSVISVVGIIYLGSFALHFALLGRSGEGDVFMSQRFQSTLKDSSNYEPKVSMPYLEKLFELNQEMYTAQATITEHPYSSRWHTWPLMTRSVYYWQGPEESGGKQGNVYLLGNPVVWWGTTAAVALIFILLLARPKFLGKRRNLGLFLLAGYAVNFVPFTFIDRPMFLYHYLFALLFAVLISCMVLKVLLEWQAKHYGHKSAIQVYWCLVLAVLVAFVYFLPLSYGWPLSPSELQQHMWLTSWR